MQRSLYHFLILLSVAITTMLLSGCPINPKRVLVIGDSISHVAAGDISRVGNVYDNDPGYRITFALLTTPGVGARRTMGVPSDPDEYWSGLIPNSIYPGDFDAVVVELGTNDCSYLSASGDYQPDIARIVGAISNADPDVPVFWLTIREHPGWPDCAPIINGDLHQIIEAGTYPNLTTFDYGIWGDAHLECFDKNFHPYGLWTSDPISGGTSSPEPAGYCNGQYQYATWLKAQLDGHFGPKEIL